MVFKRRERRPWWNVIARFLWPKGGWTRALHYISHRLRRLSDPPHRIARGILAGVLVTFTPFFGFHFILAAAVAWIVRGNIIAAMLATFMGNPFTFFLIGALSIRTGEFILGKKVSIEGELGRSLGGKFIYAWRDMQHNIVSAFTDAEADWENLSAFYHEVFLPYLIGGLVCGAAAGVTCYYFSLPIIRVYKSRRKGRLKDRIRKFGRNAAARADALRKGD
ncbi:MAG: DUF2062 domain-containing protein [Roseovarius sp.]|nr:DUF2062 domain-containing protein [Roseovarius sp.]